MTLLTSGTLHRYTPSVLSRTAYHFTMDRGEPYPYFLLDPPYQRESVWGLEQRRALIKSLQMGLPIGGVWTNLRSYTEPFAVIDGRQRIETLQAWTNDEFSVPASWFEPRDLNDSFRDVAWVSASDLSDIGRRRTDNWGIGEYQVHKLSVRQEAELYLLINFGGTPQSDADRLRAERVAR